MTGRKAALPCWRVLGGTQECLTEVPWPEMPSQQVEVKKKVNSSLQSLGLLSKCSSALTSQGQGFRKGR